MSTDPTLLPALLRLAELQRQAVQRLAVEEAVNAAGSATAPPAAGPRHTLLGIASHLGVPAPRWLAEPDPAQVPALAHQQGGGWRVLVGRNARGQWVLQHWSVDEARWQESAVDSLDGALLARLSLVPPFSAARSPVLALVLAELRRHRRSLLEAGLGGLLVGVIGLVASFYSMQVYDRVIPSGAMQTLMVLSVGAVIAAVMELLARRARSRLYDELIDAVDQRLARAVYLRLLDVRLDQLPASVGSLAGQLRGYEVVRGFLTQATASVLVDLPFALVFLGLVALIGGVLAWVPLSFLLIATTLGLATRRRLEALSREAAQSGHLKTGLLVESVEGAETLKSGQGGWRMLSRWLGVTQQSRQADLASRRITEDFQHLMGSFQQLAYIALVAWGAWLVSHGALSMGSLVACSILAGRVLAPFTLIAGQTLQWSHAKAALQGLDAIWRLEDDHAGHEPVLVDQVRGHFRCDNVELRYAGRTALRLPELQIRPGERVGVVGPVGAGKTSLLRLLAGLHRPQQGRVLLDDVDLAHLARPVLAEHLGYLQQDGRLFAGTLRDNLTLGLVDPGDEAILQAARHTGLLESVVTPHPRGLQQPIHEGGLGLSGGQRQLVNVTRVLLRHPRLWLLDEPTSAVDGATEQRLIGLLAHAVQPGHTLVLVTHKPELLQLVDRLIVIAGHQVVMDGPKAQVLAKLQAPAHVAAPTQATPASTQRSTLAEMV